MTVKDGIKILLSASELTQEGLGTKLGLKSRSAVSVPLSRNDAMGMRVETLIRWLDVLDADLVIQPRTGNIDDEILLDGE